MPKSTSMLPTLAGGSGVAAHELTSSDLIRIVDATTLNANRDRQATISDLSGPLGVDGLYQWKSNLTPWVGEADDRLDALEAADVALDTRLDALETTYAYAQDSSFGITDAVNYTYGINLPKSASASRRWWVHANIAGMASNTSAQMRAILRHATDGRFGFATATVCQQASTPTSAIGATVSALVLVPSGTGNYMVELDVDMHAGDLTNSSASIMSMFARPL